MIKPLQPNDRVALACPGSICLSAHHPQLVKDFLQQHYQLDAQFNLDTYTSGLSPQQRADYFLTYLLNDDIKLIAALRGGEGCADILPYLHQHQQTIRALPPKWLLGFSDFTALLVYFAKFYRWPVVHGASILQFALQTVNQTTEQATMNQLFGRRAKLTLADLKPLNTAAQQINTAINAELTGGCLSLIDISIKDIWEIETDNKIIFFEDCGEEAHKILRTLKYFARIGLFAHAKAVIFGDFTCNPVGLPAKQEHNRVAILNSLASFAAHHANLPVLYTTEFGHGKTNLPLTYATPYQLQLGPQPHLLLQ